jgi:hypothetical protein
MNQPVENGTSVVPLRDYLELQIQHEREMRRLTEENVRQALLLQSSEYERRLDVLNHSQQKQQDVIVATVSRERFDEYLKTHGEFASAQIEDIDRHFARIDRQLALYSGGLTVLVLVLKFVPIGFGLVQ